MAEFLKVVGYKDGSARLREHFPHRREEVIVLEEAQGRVLAGSLTAPEDIPAYHRSTVDGYAIDAQDSYGCSESLPAYLQWVGEIKIGQNPGFTVQKGQCAWIPTGGMLPEGCNAAVMVEYTEKLGEDSILIYRPAGPGENVMYKGEDIKAGQTLFQAGKILRPQDIGLLASLGITRVEVYRPYQAGILSTGDEVVPIDARPSGGEVRDVNSYSLAAAVARTGNKARTYPLVKDDFQALKTAVEKGLDENDLLLLSGGSSVGLMDHTLDVLLSFPGAELLFHGLAVKPGKPTLGVVVDGKMIIGLPGHPVSALMMYYILCDPLLRSNPATHIEARVTQNIASQPGRDDFIPVQIIEDSQGIYTARPLLGKSGLMSILAMADAYLHIPYTAQGVKAGEKCFVTIF